MNETDRLYIIIGRQVDTIGRLRRQNKECIDNSIKLYFDGEEARKWAIYYKQKSETCRPIYTIT